MEDWNWVTSDNARTLLDDCRTQLAAGRTNLQIQKSLRKTGLVADRVQMLLQQTELRLAAKSKFQRADEMFFTTQGLQQSSGESVSRYKLLRFKAALEVIDACCGIGGDTISLAGCCGNVVGIDRDPVMCHIAPVNVEVHGHRCHVNCQEFDPTSGLADAYLHIDPDRRNENRRFTNVDFFSPDIQVIDAAMKRFRGGGIKLAPASQIPADWIDKTEQEWIGTQRECKQLIVWFGELAKLPGSKLATIIDESGTSLSSVLGTNSDIQTCQQLGSYVIEPRSTIAAAGLIDDFAEKYELSRVSAESNYLTGENSVADQACQVFRVQDVLPLRLPELKKYLEANGIGQLEVKKSGVDSQLQQAVQQWRLKGDESRTVLLTTMEKKQVAIITDRVG